MALRTLTAARARVVWCQDAGDGTDVAAKGNSLRLMGFDTDDGRGERRILADLSNYTKPMLTPDGNKVIFSNRQEQKIYVVGFDGSGLKALATGIAVAVWRDALNETDWIYSGVIATPSDAAFNTLFNNIRRFRLDKPEVSEPVWTQTPLDLHNFQLSADGRHAGGQFPWPFCGIATLPDREWEKIGDGCWPSLSPDYERLFWIFDGAHRNLAFSRINTGERWLVNINHAPGIDGFEVYHPRWSNHPRFMSMTGPYKAGDGGNRIFGGGRDVEVYIGKFSGDFKKVERWVQVTRNQSADFCPDLWLAGRPVAAPAPAAADAVTASAPSAGAWPGSREALVFLWQNRSKENMITDPATGRSYACRAEPKGLARYERYFEMAPSGGAFIADGGAGDLVKACAASGQLALEAVITPDPDPKEQLLPIIGHAARPGVWNFLLGQRGRRLVFELRAANGGPDYVIPVGALAGNIPHSVMVSCSSSSVVCYLNGEPAGHTGDIASGNWEHGSIVFGNEWRKKYAVNHQEGPTGWKGLIENVALYSRRIGLDEAREKYKASTAKILRRAPIPALSVNATLISMPDIPAPESIAPYRRALALGEYRIETLIEGTCSHREVMIAQWVILDGQTWNAGQRQKGETYRLKLEPFSDHPELEGERLIMDSENYHLPLYYELR